MALVEMARQRDLLDQLLSKKPVDVRPVLHSDMRWQYQHAMWCSRLRSAGIVQSMSRKGNCIRQRYDRAGVRPYERRVFRGREWACFEDFKEDLDEYIVHWNTKRRQVKLKELTPEELRNQSLAA